MSALNLINLPTEVLIGIFNNLSIKDILNCSLVCKKLNEVLRTPTFYRQHSIIIPECSTDKLESFIQWFEPISSAKKISCFLKKNSDCKDPSEIRSKFSQINGDCKFLEILEINDRRESSNKIVYQLPRTLQRLEARFDHKSFDFTGTQGLKELKIGLFVPSWPITTLPPFIERCTNLVSLEIFKCKFSAAEIMTFAKLENLESLSLSTKIEQDMGEILIEALKKCSFSKLKKLSLHHFKLKYGDVYDQMAVKMPRICSFIFMISGSYKDCFSPLNLYKFAQYLESQPNITEVILHQTYLDSYDNIQEFLNRLTEISKMNTKLCFEINLCYERVHRLVFGITAVKDKTNDISVSEKYIYVG